MDIKVRVKELVAKFKDMPLEFEPGCQFAYSNSGYVLLGAVIEQVSGETYSAYLNEHIFTPLEMNRSGYLNMDNINSDRAVGYSIMVNDNPHQAELIDMSVPFSAGGIYSTAEDLRKWIQGLENSKIISKSSWEKMRTPNLANYGLGWLIPQSNRMVYGHDGAINGFSSMITRNITEGTTVILLSNVEGAPLGGITQSLLEMLDRLP